jgi:hypothetical protein
MLSGEGIVKLEYRPQSSGGDYREGNCNCEEVTATAGSELHLAQFEVAVESVAGHESEA